MQEFSEFSKAENVDSPDIVSTSNSSDGRQKSKVMQIVSTANKLGKQIQVVSDSIKDSHENSNFRIHKPCFIM